MQATLKMVGDWSNQIQVPLESALQATTEITGKSGRAGCVRALIYMAQSAKTITKQARKNRKTRKDKSGTFVERYSKASKSEYKFYTWMVGKHPFEKIKTWDQAREIKSRGLAKRSWFWGLRGLASQGSKPMPGVADNEEIITPNLCGFVLTDKLNYLLKIMPTGWEKEVSNKASNRIMAQVARTVERKFSIEVPRLAESRKRKAGTLAQEWVK